MFEAKHARGVNLTPRHPTALVFVVLLCLVSCFFFFHRSPKDAVYDIVVIGGQSNSTSAGEGPFHDPESGKARESDIFQIGRFGPDNHELIAATDSLQDWDFSRKNKRKSIGFGMAFARRYAEHCLAPDRRLLLLAGGLGGSSILEWDQSVDFPGDSPTLFDDLIFRAKWARDLNSANRIVAILWHQGESDIDIASHLGESGNMIRTVQGHATVPPTLMPDANVYAARFTKLIEAFRAQLGRPELPFLAGEFSREWQTHNPVKAQFIESIQKVLNGQQATAFVSSENLPAAPANEAVHFTAASQIELGSRYFEAYRPLGCKDETVLTH